MMSHHPYNLEDIIYTLLACGSAAVQALYHTFTMPELSEDRLTLTCGVKQQGTYTVL